jgi:predicted DNA-binding transcriptional regulator AlpA
MLEKQMADTEAQTLWRFRDLKAKGIVTDRATLRRWMKSPDDPFPSPIVLSANSIAWRASEICEWLDNRSRGPAPQPRHQEVERRAQLRSGGLPGSFPSAATAGAIHAPGQQTSARERPVALEAVADRRREHETCSRTNSAKRAKR